MKTYILAILFIFMNGCVYSQNVWRVDTTSGAENLVISTSEFTAFTVRVYGKQIMPIVKVGTIIQPLEIDEHIEGEGYRQSVLSVYTNSKIELLGESHTKYEIIFQHVPSIQSNDTRSERRAACEAPQMIIPSVWRAGLADPKPNPVSTQTRHCIVHHSAGGNGNTDYTSLVRNYYTQHTQVNGWDDIGYNFLVAIDGTVFIGRDKQNLTVPQYQVKGAHFCAKNDGTAGVCLIGNFTDIAPSDTMIESLKKVLSWIAFEEAVNATDSTPHPTPTDAYLTNIAGHRQGCATECPGNNTYAMLPSVRTEVEAQRQICNQLISIENVANKEKVSYTLMENRLQINAAINWILYDLSGKVIANSKALNNNVFLKTGIYVLSSEKSEVEKIYIN